MKKIALLLALLLTASLLFGCAKTVVKVEKVNIDENGNIVVVYTDGSSEGFGKTEIKKESADTEKQPAAGKTVDKIEVNEEYHVIITYTDGSTEDYGYVGVEVEPPLYTVTFVGEDGKTLKTEQIYRGRGATAPEAPAVADKSFEKWDVAFDNVQSDITVTAVYRDAERYTVTFVNEDGTVLKTEEVIAGHAATAPDDPTVSGKLFDGWDCSFDRVQGNLTVTATYRLAGSYTVTFKDYSGIVLGTVTVKEGENASAPVTPSREGYKFTGWSGSLKGIKKNTAVTAEYSLNSGTNILDLSAKVSGSELTVTVAVKGNVNVCGLQGTIKVPAGLTFVSNTDGDGSTFHYADGEIAFMFSSGSGKNVTKSFTLSTLKFKIASGASETVKLTTELSDIYDQDFNPVSKSVIGQSIRVK